MSTRPNRRYALALLSLLVIGTALAAADYVVHVQRLLIRSNKGSMYPVVREDQYQLNDVLPVIERQSDGWLKVKVGDKDGYVKETALAAGKSMNLGGITPGAGGMSGNAQTSDVSASAAASGLDEAKAFAVDKHYDITPLIKMRESRQRVEGQPWLNFTYAANLAPYKK